VGVVSLGTAAPKMTSCTLVDRDDGRDGRAVAAEQGTPSAALHAAA